MSTQWIDLSPYWDEHSERGRLWTEAKRNYKSARRYSQYDTNFVGFLGEQVFEELTGVPMDKAMRPEGDGGVDFRIGEVGYDIKATTYEDEYGGIYLMEYLDPDDPRREEGQWHKRIVADILILVFVDMENRQGRVVGWVTREQMEKNRIQDFSHGFRRWYSEGQMRIDLQDGLPALGSKTGR